MRVVIQRAKKARVYVEKEKVAEIGKGLVVFLGLGKNDTESVLTKIIEKLPRYRIFEDENNKMNLSVVDVNGEVLVVSEFTLYGDLTKGLRPSFTEAMDFKEAKRLYEYFVSKLEERGIKVKTGVFGAKMLVEIHNDGPVTFILEE